MLRRFKHLEKPISQFAECLFITLLYRFFADDCTWTDNAIQLNDVRISVLMMTFTADRDFRLIQHLLLSSSCASLSMRRRSHGMPHGRLLPTRSFLPTTQCFPYVFSPVVVLLVANRVFPGCRRPLRSGQFRFWSTFFQGIYKLSMTL